MIYISQIKIYPDFDSGQLCLISAPSLARAREDYTAALAQGAKPLLLTVGPLADSDALKKLLSGLNGAGVCWDISSTVSAGEPARTTIKAIGRFIRAVCINNKAQLAALDLLKEQGFDQTVICPPELMKELSCISKQ